MSDAGVSVGASCTCAIIPSVFEQTEYKAMNMDQWTGFLRFCEEVEVVSPPQPALIASFNRDTMLCFGM
jgi:hypothetical protein